MHLTGKMVKNVILPESTKNAIMEDDLEDDYASEEEPAQDESQEKGE
jgi:hypothetical protein